MKQQKQLGLPFPHPGACTPGTPSAPAGTACSKGFEPAAPKAQEARARSQDCLQRPNKQPLPGRSFFVTAGVSEGGGAEGHRCGTVSSESSSCAASA